MEWRQYEKEILAEFREAYPDATILPNQFIKGRKTKRKRQIDVWIEGHIAGVQFTIAVDCKSYSRRVDIKKVESFIGMLDDLGAQYGIIITQKGYTSGALLRAQYETAARIELDIVSLEELRVGQGFVGLPYSGFHGVLVPAPFGWVLDATQMDGALATLYQRGLDREMAIDAKQWMYVKIAHKEDSIQSIDDFMLWQEQATRSHEPLATFEYGRGVTRKDGALTRMRTIAIPHYPTKEYTGVVEFDSYFAYFVMFTPDEHHAKNIRKLLSVLERCMPFTWERESFLSYKIDPLKEQLKSLTDPMDRSENLLRQAGILLDASEFGNVDGLLAEAIQNYRPNYGAYRYRLRMYLEQKRPLADLEAVVDNMFSVEPTNPVVCQTPMELFSRARRLAELVKVFERKVVEYADYPEARGNVRYHLAFLYDDEMNQPGVAKELLSKANHDFQACLPLGHVVFGNIKKRIRLLERRSRNTQ